VLGVHPENPSVTRVTRGNFAAAASDWIRVRCDRFREAASARLDGEPIGMSASALDHHLASCTDCARWVDAATRLTRELRLRQPAVPDLAAAITDRVVLPAQRVRRRLRLLRTGLLVVGVAQLGIAAPSVADDSIGMAMSMHAAHESSAWNLAIGVAFLAAATRPRRAAGLIPLLGTFIVVLAALSVHDVLTGAVGAVRLATHLGALLGLLLLIGLERAQRAMPPGSSGAARRRRDADGDGPSLRGVA
jgi:predicted anti-sigma-YlaC factor YlaD